MKKVTFRDCWTRQTYYLSLIMIFGAAGKVITQLLTTHYHNNLAAKMVILCFKPPFNINIDQNVALLVMVASFLFFAFLEYVGKNWQNI